MNWNAIKSPGEVFTIKMLINLDAGEEDKALEERRCGAGTHLIAVLTAGVVRGSRWGRVLPTQFPITNFTRE